MSFPVSMSCRRVHSTGVVTALSFLLRTVWTCRIKTIDQIKTPQASNYKTAIPSVCLRSSAIWLSVCVIGGKILVLVNYVTWGWYRFKFDHNRVWIWSAWILLQKYTASQVHPKLRGCLLSRHGADEWYRLHSRRWCWLAVANSRQGVVLQLGCWAGNSPP
jgi:hypothetical protein